MTYVVAHRGLSSKSPENTYHSFDLAISSGINYIEFDVQLTKDKEVVIWNNYGSSWPSFLDYCY